MDYPILFDTHAWLWTMAGEKQFSSKIINLIEEKRQNNSLYLSDISLWEICMLAKKGRITLGQPTLPWLKNAIKCSNVRPIHLTPEIAFESTELPGNFHGDPSDRLIVATARLLSLAILTRDDKILTYGNENRVHTLAI